MTYFRFITVTLILVVLLWNGSPHTPPFVTIPEMQEKPMLVVYTCTYKLSYAFCTSRKCTATYNMCNPLYCRPFSHQLNILYSIIWQQHLYYVCRWQHNNYNNGDRSVHRNSKSNCLVLCQQSDFQLLQNKGVGVWPQEGDVTVTSHICPSVLLCCCICHSRHNKEFHSNRT